MKNYEYWTIERTLINNGDRHYRNGLKHIRNGKLEYAIGSFRKAKRNYDKAKNLYFEFTPIMSLFNNIVNRMQEQISDTILNDNSNNPGPISS